MSYAVRLASPKDAQKLLSIYQYYVNNTAITFETEVPTIEEFEQRIRTMLLTHPYLVVFDTNEPETLLGYAYAHAFYGRAAYSHSAEVSIYLDWKTRGKHLGSLLYIRLEELLVAQHVTNLIAVITSADEGGSIGFHEHMGYRTVGTLNNCGYKFSSWYSVTWMEKIIAPHEPNPLVFIPFSQMQQL
ncbi:MAG: N-acetyltransferase [Coriobacteriales bacterium]|nr:N-acetyltransferase [Coriobacteriales bacterium]